jgi:penicillin G amidase
MRRTGRGLVVAVAAVLFVAALVFGAWVFFTRWPYPLTRGTIRVDGLSAPVEILRDSYGVPHLYARTSADLFFAEGFVHAQDRFWQMEDRKSVV